MRVYAGAMQMKGPAKEDVVEKIHQINEANSPKLVNLDWMDAFPKCGA